MLCGGLEVESARSRGANQEVTRVMRVTPGRAAVPMRGETCFESFWEDLQTPCAGLVKGKN